MNMDFVYDNYVWFIVAGVILLMALIGYIAEKTNFGRSQFEKKVKKEPKVKNKEVQPVEEMVIETPVEETEFENGVVIDDKDWMEPPLEINSMEFDNNEEVVNNFDDEVLDESLFAPLGDAKVENENTNQMIDEDLTVPFGDQEVKPIINEVIPDEIEEINNDEVPNFEDNNNELTPPNIDTLKKDNEEDVWKF